MVRNQESDITAIRQLAADWRQGWIDGDVAFVLSLYTNDPVLMPSGQPAVFGIDAIRPMYEVAMGAVDLDSRYEIRDIEVSGDLGYFWCTYTLMATPKEGGETFEVDGKYLCIVKRQADDTWKIARLIDNSDQ
jgi:uncharacterized protein (TIGR02246 family)